MADEDIKKTDESSPSEPEQPASVPQEQEQSDSLDGQPSVDEPTNADMPHDAIQDENPVPQEQPEEASPSQNDDTDTDTKPIEAVNVTETMTQAEQFAKIVSGMTVRVHQKIKDVNSKGEEKERIQVFEGMVLAHKHGAEAGASITVRKIANGVGVEKIFPLNLPSIEKIEIVKQANMRQSRPYFLRNYKKRLKEKRINTTLTPA